MNRRGQSALTRMAAWSANHPWKAILLWLVLVAAAVGAGSATTKRQATEAQLQVGQAARAATMVNDASLQQPATENVLITAPNGRVDTPEATQAVTELRQRVGALSGVRTVSDPIPSRDGQAVLVQVTMAGDYDTANTRVQPLLTATAEVQRAHPGLRIEEAGNASINREFQDWIGKDIAKATKISVPVTLIILVIAFGSLMMAGVPVLLALSAVGGVLGLWALASQVFPDPGMVPDVIVLMGMAVGVDYSLFYLRRYREERSVGQDKVRAVEVAAATSGHAVIVSGVAAILTMSAMYLAGDLVFSSMATGAVLVIAMAMISSMTALPALLVKLGARTGTRSPRFFRRLREPGRRSRVWPVLLGPALRHPFLSLVVSVAALAALAYPALHLNLKSTQLTDFPRSLSTMRTYDRLLAHFPATDNTDVVVVRVPADQSGALPGRVDQLVSAAGQNPLYASDVPAKPRYSTDGRVAVVDLNTPFAFDSARARDSVRQLRDNLVPEAFRSIPGATYAVGGGVAADLDYTANLRTKLPVVVGVVLLLTFLVMAVAFRSLAIALTTVLLNLLSTSAAFGFMSLVFQHKWAEKVLGFTSTGHVVSWVPMLLFVVLSGLSLDYHVFVVTRIREDKLSGMTTRNAVASGISRTATVVTSAAVVMVAVFAIFGTLTFIELKQIGVGLAVAIILDATIIRIVVLPAVMALLGEANWWPGRRRPGRATTRTESNADTLVTVD